MHTTDMDHVLMLFVLLWSSGLQTDETDENDTLKEIDETRLVGGSSRCSGRLQVNRRGRWTEVDSSMWDLKLADVVCSHLDCGSVVQALSTQPRSSPWIFTPSCLKSDSSLRKCLTKRSQVAQSSLELICSDSVRLVNGTSLCSGRLEVRSNQSWSSVCEDDFKLQDAQVVCRELGCGAPSVFQGGLYGEAEAPVWSKELQCGGHESAVLDCDSPGSARSTCSPGKAVGLTCAEPDTVRLVGGSSRCAGELEVRQWGRWRKVDDPTSEWSQKAADAVCQHLDCGSAVSTRKKWDNLYKYLWQIKSTCLQLEFAVRECVSIETHTSLNNLIIICSGH